LLQTGCRCCCLLDPYATAIDHLKEYPVVFDSWYHPRLDISRAGKPDWCGPINSHLAPCRCDCVPEFKRFDPIWQYPPRHPYDFPGWAYPGPSQYEASVNSPAAPEPMTEEDIPPKPLPPAPAPEP
jgi:hypothetical protein